jgi:hypothetical protein
MRSSVPRPLFAGRRYGAPRPMTQEAQRLIGSIIAGQYVERWPDLEADAILGGRELSYTDRISVGTFLFGNLRDAQLVYAAVREQLGADPKDHDHLRRWLADLASGKYDDRVYYLDVLEGDYYYLGGALHAARAPPASACVRLMNAWERECARMRREEGRWPTLAEQHAFMCSFGSG